MSAGFPKVNCSAAVKKPVLLHLQPSAAKKLTLRRSPGIGCGFARQRLAMAVGVSSLSTRLLQPCQLEGGCPLGSAVGLQATKHCRALVSQFSTLSASPSCNTRTERSHLRYGSVGGNTYQPMCSCWPMQKFGCTLLPKVVLSPGTCSFGTEERMIATRRYGTQLCVVTLPVPIVAGRRGGSEPGAVAAQTCMQGRKATSRQMRVAWLGSHPNSPSARSGVVARRSVVHSPCQSRSTGVLAGRNCRQALGIASGLQSATTGATKAPTGQIQACVSLRVRQLQLELSLVSVALQVSALQLPAPTAVIVRPVCTPVQQHCFRSSSFPVRTVRGRPSDQVPRENWRPRSKSKRPLSVGGLDCFRSVGAIVVEQSPKVLLCTLQQGQMLIGKSMLQDTPLSTASSAYTSWLCMWRSLSVTGTACVGAGGRLQQAPCTRTGMNLMGRAVLTSRRSAAPPQRQQLNAGSSSQLVSPESFSGMKQLAPTTLPAQRVVFPQVRALSQSFWKLQLGVASSCRHPNSCRAWTSCLLGRGAASVTAAAQQEAHQSSISLLSSASRAERQQTKALRLPHHTANSFKCVGSIRQSRDHTAHSFTCVAKEWMSCRQRSLATSSHQSMPMPVLHGLAQKGDLPRLSPDRESERYTWHPLPVQPISSARPVEPTGPIRARLRLCTSDKLHSCHLRSWEASGNVLVQQLLVLPSFSRPPCTCGARASSTVFVLPSRVLLSLACLQKPWFSFVAAGDYKGCPVQAPQVPARALSSASPAPTSLWRASPEVSTSPEAISNNNNTIAARLGGGGLASGGLPVLLSVPLHVEVEPRDHQEQPNYSSARGDGLPSAKLQAVEAVGRATSLRATRCCLHIIAAAIRAEVQVLPPQLLVQTVERRRFQAQPLKTSWPSFCGGFALTSSALGRRCSPLSGPAVKLQGAPIRVPGHAMKQSRQFCCCSHAVQAAQPRGSTSAGSLTPCRGDCELLMSPFFDVASTAAALAPVELGWARHLVRRSLLSSTLETCIGQVALRLASLGKADAASSYFAVTCTSTPETDSVAQHNQSHMKRSVGSNGLSIVCKQALTAHRYLGLQNKSPPVDSASASGCSGSVISHNQRCIARTPVCFCSCLPVAADLISSTSATSPRPPIVRLLTRRLLPCFTPCEISSPGMMRSLSAGRPCAVCFLSLDDRLAVLLAGPLERLEANSTVLCRAASHACANWHATTSILVASKPSWRKQAWIPPFLSCLARAALPESIGMPPLKGQSQAASSPLDGNCKVRCAVLRCCGVTNASLLHVKASCLFAQFAGMAPSCNEVFCDIALMSASSEPRNSLHRFEPVPVRGAGLHSLDEVLSPREGPSITAIHGTRLLRLHALTRPISSRGCSHFFQESAWKLPVPPRPVLRASTHRAISAVSSWMPWMPQQSMKGTGCNAPSVHQLCGFLRSKAPLACLGSICRRSTPGWRSLADCVSNSVVHQDPGCTRLEFNTTILLALLVCRYCSMDQLELGLCCSTSDGGCAVSSRSATSTPGLDSWVSKMSGPSGSRTSLFCLPPLNGRVPRRSRVSRSRSVFGRFTCSLSSASAHQCARPMPILCFRSHNNNNIFPLLREHFRKAGSTASAAPAVSLLCPPQSSFDGFLHRKPHEWSHHALVLMPPTKISLSSNRDPIGHASLLRRRPFAAHCGGAVVCTCLPILDLLDVPGTSRVCRLHTCR
ncbi:unnamed protein product [Polarella glacialis]|uniref:Uncharacterized protein n=1 Tax=Polarella glacialis TaxID=89957 RepID=A0A813GZ90_POLGL|nr:unnamed protein product [Polarella glacialis]